MSEYEFVAWLVFCVGAFSFGAGYCFSRLRFALGWMREEKVEVHITLDRAALLQLFQHPAAAQVNSKQLH